MDEATEAKNNGLTISELRIMKAKNQKFMDSQRSKQKVEAATNDFNTRDNQPSTASKIISTIGGAIQSGAEKVAGLTDWMKEHGDEYDTPEKAKKAWADQQGRGPSKGLNNGDDMMTAANAWVNRQK